MGRVREGAIGILPAGALGVGFFYHLTGRLRHNDGSVYFLSRPESSSGRALAGAGLRLADTAGTHQLSATLFHGDLLSAFASGELPEAVLVCTNPDQLTEVLNTFVRLLEAAHERGELMAFQPPAFVLSSNGIYFQRQRQLFIERLEESTLLGRLPDLWPDLMPRLVGRLLRGVTIQTGIRDGSGAEAIYHPGPSGITRLAGGDPQVRQRVYDLFRRHGAWFELATDATPTRVEFDKAMVNMVSNLLGQIQAIDEQGHFTPLTVSQIVTRAGEPRTRELTRHVFGVGCAVRAYPPNEDFEAVYRTVMETNRQHDDHIPSSLQWVGLRLRQGKLEPQLTPTETWLLDPLIRYAHAAGLMDSADYFESLRAELLQKLELATRQSPKPEIRDPKEIRTPKSEVR